MKGVAIYGQPGSYTEQAALNYFGSGTKFTYYNYISEVFDAVERGLDYGIVPIENSIEGAVTQTYDQMIGLKLHIVGETILRVNHCLIANKWVRLQDVDKVYSLQQALGQCKEYLQKLKVQIVPYYDTAGSVRMIKEKRLSNSAAIASERSAGIYGMRILAKYIETNKHNYTRFFVVSKVHNGIKGDKTSLVFSLKSRPGALHEALGAFADNKIDLTYLQSRPILGKPWDYNFYVDFKGDGSDKNVKKALNELKNSTKFIKILGSYKKAKQ